MPVQINDITYYHTAETCEMLGICRKTLCKWLGEGRFSGTEYRDWRGWRLFTKEQLWSVVKTDFRAIDSKVGHNS
jgi:hypothetical protein